MGITHQGKILCKGPKKPFQQSNTIKAVSEETQYNASGGIMKGRFGRERNSEQDDGSGVGAMNRRKQLQRERGQGPVKGNS